MKTKWTKETPAEEGWYWIKYRHGRSYKCPCEVTHLKIGTIVHTGRHTFMEGPNHGGKGLKLAGLLIKSIRFGPKLVVPD